MSANVFSLVHAIYFLATFLFILGMKRLSSPSTARSGNRLAFLGMLLAVSVTFAAPSLQNRGMILIGIFLGSAVGAILAYRVKMTDVPQMVAVFNGMGGAAAALVETSEFLHNPGAPPIGLAWIILSGTLIGYLAFSGSFVAFAKLQGLIPSKPIANFTTRLLFFFSVSAILILGGLMLSGKSSLFFFAWLSLFAFLLGVSAVLPVGGADMPVIISLLNALTGLSVAFAGLALKNFLLIISGILVGASGTLLTGLMCGAMNRSLAHILFGAFTKARVKAGDTAIPGAAQDRDRTVQKISAEDVAILLTYARQAIIVPGYGLAVAQAQHQVRQLADLLEKRGVAVKYAIHPVAGRMPGHMNVLLAEANVPYSQLFEMEEINPEFSRTDVVLVIGANDVVNPAARTLKESPIYGMPILDVDRAEKVIVLKRSMNPGFSGMENELFYNPKTYLFLGDARDSLQKLMSALKSV